MNGPFQALPHCDRFEPDSELRMSDWAEKRSRMNASLRKIVVPELRSQGFTGSFPHFRKIVGDHVRVIGFQFSQWGPQFYVELGVCGIDGATFGTTHYAADKIKHYQSQFRRRIGANPFDYENADTDEIARDVSTTLKNSDKAWTRSVEKWRKAFRNS